MLLIPLLLVGAPTVYLLATRKSSPPRPLSDGRGCPPALEARARDLIARAEAILLLPPGAPTLVALPSVNPDEMVSVALALDVCDPPPFPPRTLPPSPPPMGFTLAETLRFRAGELRLRQVMQPAPPPSVPPAAPTVPGAPGINPFPSMLPQDMLDQANALLFPRLGVTPSPVAIDDLIRRIQARFPGGFADTIRALQIARG